MESRERTLVVLGPKGAGKATTTGCMLFQYGAIEMTTMDMFQREGIATYDQAANRLKRDGVATAFETPKYHVTILDTPSSLADCAMLVLPADNLPVKGTLKDYVNVARKLIVVVNKMDTISWSQEQFLKIVEGLNDSTKSVPIIPVSAQKGDNFVERSPSSEWFNGSVLGIDTVLEALESSFQD